MASWDNVQTIGPPSLVPPKVDFSPLGELGTAYYQGQQQQRQQAIQNAFKGGLPRTDPNDPNSPPDFKAAAYRMFQLGAPEQGMKYLGLVPEKPTPNPYEPQPAAGGAATMPSATPPRQTASPTGYSGGDNGQNTVASFVTDALGNVPILGRAIVGVARSLGVDPNQPLTADQQQKLAPVIARLGGPQQSQQPAGGQGLQPQPVPAGPQPAQVQPQPVPQQPQQPQAQSQSNPDADQMVPVQLRGTYTGAQWRDKLRSAQFEAQEQAKAMDKAAALSGIKYDSSAIKARAEDYGRQAADIDKVLAPTEAQKDVRRGIPAEKINQEEEAKRQTAYAGGIDAVARQFRQQGGRDILLNGRSILNQPQLYTGIGSSGVLDANKIRAAFGGDPRGAQYAEAVSKLGSLMALNTVSLQKFEQSEAGGSGAGKIFQAQVEEARKTGLANENTVAGNMYLVEYHLRMGDFFSHLQDMKNKYLDTHRTLDRGFDEIVKKDMEQHPIFTDEERKNPSLIGAPTSPYSDAKQMKAWAQQMGLKPGEAVRSPSGRLTHVPDLDANGNLIPFKVKGQ